MTIDSSRRWALRLLLCLVSFALSASHAGAQAPTVIDSPSSAVAPIHLAVGRSGVLLFSSPVERASVNNPDVLEVVVVSPTQLLLNGKQAGATSVVIWYEGENQLLTVTVEPDLEPLRRLLHQMFPSETLDVQSWENGVVLTGEASSEEVRDRAEAAAKSSGATVTNLVNVKTRQVVIEVRFAEVNRTLSRSLGFDYILQAPDATQAGFLGAGLTPQLPASPQFGRVADGGDLSLSSTITEVLELRRGTDISFALRALQEKGLVRILAEPNLVAQSGKEASFLAGGEFPIPVVQSSSGGTVNNAVTIEFKKFGVQLKFRPDVIGEDDIRLFVEPEVSVLDFSTAAVTLGGFEIPGLVVRRASTTVQMRSGESLAIGGLLSQMNTRTNNKLPWLGEIPILGKLFSSEQFQREETELLVVVTPRLVKPSTLPDTRPATTAAQLQRVLEQHREGAPYPDGQGETLRRTIEGLHRTDE